VISGESGLGKATLINSLFLADIYSNEHPGPSLRVKKTVQVETSKCLLKENGVNLLLTVVDTPGFGDAVDNSNWLVNKQPGVCLKWDRSTKTGRFWLSSLPDWWLIFRIQEKISSEVIHETVFRFFSEHLFGNFRLVYYSRSHFRNNVAENGSCDLHPETPSSESMQSRIEVYLNRYFPKFLSYMGVRYPSNAKYACS